MKNRFQLTFACNFFLFVYLFVYKNYPKCMISLSLLFLFRYSSTLSLPSIAEHRYTFWLINKLWLVYHQSVPVLLFTLFVYLISIGMLPPESLSSSCIPALFKNSYRQRQRSRLVLENDTGGATLPSCLGYLEHSFAKSPHICLFFDCFAPLFAPCYFNLCIF